MAHSSVNKSVVLSVFAIISLILFVIKSTEAGFYGSGFNSPGSYGIGRAFIGGNHGGGGSGGYGGGGGGRGGGGGGGYGGGGGCFGCGK